MTAGAASVRDVAALIDHSLLRPDASREALEKCCEEAMLLEVASVCLLPYFVRDASQILASSPVLTTTTVAFPHGAQSLPQKLAETSYALDAGADEVDVVVNLSQVKSGNFAYLKDEIRALTELCQGRGRRIKTIFETALLTDPEKVRLCELASESGVDFVKTSTGFGPGGATAHDVELLRRHTAPSIGVKASGGIRSLEALLAFRTLGATRIGTSNSRSILEACSARPE